MINKSTIRYVIERKGRLYVIIDDMGHTRKIKMIATEIEQRWPGLIARAVADGLVPASVIHDS